MPLENPSDSPCFGCGPLHARGLRLRFDRVKATDGADEIVCEYVPQADEVGWPGLLHTGLHFLVAYEVSYWAAMELGGNVAVTDGPSTWHQERLPRVGKPFVARARLTSETADGVRVRATTQSQEGKPLGTLDGGFRFVRRADVERWKLEVPEYLLKEMRP